MKKALVLLGMMFFFMATASAAISDKVSIHKENVPLNTILNEIERQTGMLFVYDQNEIDVKRHVSVKANGQSLTSVLDTLFGDTSVKYNVSGRNIMLTREKNAKAAAASDKKAKTQRITGTVVDNNNEPVIGATVRVAGTNTVAITDIDGNYSIDAPEGSTIEFSYLGCKPASAVAKQGQGKIDITMKEDSNLLNEVVVVGYGTQKKVNLTGAVSMVEGDELSSRTASNMTQLLQGAVPNMNIRMTNGRPGEGGSINIRGVQTLSGSADGMNPLTLIDGVEGDINTVNPADVESISVLKDASAAAVYGARAAFGVILVTTKKGNDGRAHVSYSGSYSFSSPTVSTDFETRGYYSAAINELFWYNQRGYNYTNYNEEDWYELWIRRNDKTENPDRPWVMVKDGKYKYYANTNWYDHFYNHTRPTWDHNISINGGTDKVKYYLSGNYYEQEGILRQNPDKFAKYTLRSKVDIKLAKFLSLSNNTSFYHDTYKYIGVAGVGEAIGLRTYNCLASDVPRNPDGSIVAESSAHPGYPPAQYLNAIDEYGKHRNSDRKQTFQTTFEATVSPIKQLDIVGNYSYSSTVKRNMNREVNVPYSQTPGVTETLKGWHTYNQLTEYDTDTHYHSFNLYATYSEIFAKAHNLKVMAGINYETQHREYKTIIRDGLSSDDLDDFNLATGENFSIKGGQDQYKLFGFFYRVNYDYLGRYLLEASGRYDGSSRFSPGRRYGFFPSFSAGWRVSEEPFFEPLRTAVSNAKIRFSYGKLGNQANVGYYDYIQTIDTQGLLDYIMGDNNRLPQASVSAPNSSDLTWEKVITKNIGLDLSFFNNRLTFGGDYYWRDTKDMLCAGRDLPSVYGASIPTMNAADLRTQGWELTLGWRDNFTLAGRDFGYSITASVADNTSKVLKFNNPTKTLGTPYEGMKLGEIWGYVTDGFFLNDADAESYGVDQTLVNSMINTTPVDPGVHGGDLKFVDLDGDNVIQPTLSADRPRDQKVIGNSLPRYTYSIRLTADYAGFDFSMMFQGVGRQDWYPGGETNLYWGPYARPYQTFIPKDFMTYVWTEDNPNAKFPRPRGYVAMGSNKELSVVNDRYLENVAYCRLKNLTIGYTLPKKWLEKIYMENIRIYFSGENLFCISPFKNKYIDPEQAGAQNTWRTGNTNLFSVYPNNRQFTFGVNITY